MSTDLSGKSPAELRVLFRSGELSIPTAGLCPGHLQGNLVILPRRYAEDFLTFMKQKQRDGAEEGGAQPNEGKKGKKAKKK